MEVKFRTRKLERQYRMHVEAVKEFGEQVARRYIMRINTIKAVKDFEELKRLPGLRCHPLKGARQGEWAMKLTGFWRLIFRIQGEDVQVVQIEEVSKHYDN